ncbi:MAG: hypothetical protein WA181_14820 [Bacillus mycoides]
MLKEQGDLLSEDLFEDVLDETEDELENGIYNMMREFLKEMSINEITQNLWNVAINEDGLNPAQATDRTLTEMAEYLLYSIENEIMVYKELIDLNKKINYHDSKFGFVEGQATEVRNRVFSLLNRKGREAQAALKARKII